MSHTSPRGKVAGRVGVVSIAIVAMFVAFVQSAPAHAVDTQIQPDASSPIAAVPGYKVKVFAKGVTTGKTQFYGPSSIVVDSKNVYIDYYNTTSKTGGDGKTSTIVKYTSSGKVLATYSVLGHSDGLRQDPTTGLLWALSNEDANPALYIIDPTKKGGNIQTYTFPPTQHGGGFDDLAFTGGKVYISASNPNLDENGLNKAPAVDIITVPATSGMVSLTPVLYGNATATDTISNTPVTLNLTDPDSLMVDPQGDVVLDSQADAELVFLHNPGTAQQTVTRVPVGTQLDDSAWATTAKGRLFTLDAKTSVTYTIQTTFTPNAVYSIAPGDSMVASFVGSTDLTTGVVTPIAVGFKSPTSLIFVPDAKQK